MKLLHLQQIESSIPKLINIDLPIRIAYKLNGIMDDIERHLIKIQKFRTDFLTKHGEPLPDGRWKVPNEKIQEFDEGMKDILQEDINITPVEIPLSLIIDQPISFTVLEIESLKKAGFLVDDINSNEQ